MEYEKGVRLSETVTEGLHLLLSEALPSAVSQLSSAQLRLLSCSLVSVCKPHYIVCSTAVAVGVNELKSLRICLPQIHPPSSLGGSCAPLCFRFPVRLSSFCFCDKLDLLQFLSMHVNRVCV